MSEIGFIGYGIVGQATGKGLARGGHTIYSFDKYRAHSHSLEEVIDKSEFIFICVPTPMYHDHSGIDSSIVDAVVDAVAPQVAGTKKVLIIKSTVLPGTTARYAKIYPKTNFAMVPEFLTEAKPEWDFLHPYRTIIGALDKKIANRLKKLHTSALPAQTPFFMTDPTSAELAKYMSNVMLASKVMLANEFYALAKVLKSNYDQVQKMVTADPRIGTHLKVPGPDGDLGFGGKCFPKDIVALLGLGRELKVDLSVMETIWRKNLKIRKNHDWKEIKGAVTKKLT
ncbi:UDP-glucose/GDP-mannose dehydrogenase family protein [Candidatus Microgenomates bacterium]|nr:UDP-glucose/GDP-mannose dehydrogenase family protein [Candidatus Microgenomates bacterium]